MSDTPETDNEAMDGFYRYCGSTIYLHQTDYSKTLDGEVVPIDFARRLERERDEARNLLHDAVTRGDAYMEGMDKAREQRDKLATALRWIVDESTDAYDVEKADEALCELEGCEL